MSRNNYLPRIKDLPVSLANQIAAGEVIERPASVIKELVENSIDAHADRIEIDISGGGTRILRVKDNGCGIHSEDLLLAVRRHATSKLSTQADLECISSLGFRGEALSSIASISDFRITSRTSDDEHGWVLQIESDGKSHDIQPAAHPVGTTIESNNLFRTTPARRKFLRTERTEFLHILNIVKGLAMSHFDISIELNHDGKSVLKCIKVKEDFQLRLQAVLGKQFYQSARKIDYRKHDMYLWGWLGGENTDRSQSDRQYFYLNRRIIRDQRINHAIRMALENTLPQGRYPSYLLHLQIDPSTTDVNVHPTKKEVRFKDPRNVHDFIYTALRSILDTEQSGHRLIDGQYSTGSLGFRLPGIREAVSQLYQARSQSPLTGQQWSQQLNEDNPFGLAVAIIHERYVIALYKGSLRLIDLRSARAQYVHNQLKLEFDRDDVIKRPLLVPLAIKASEEEMKLLLENRKLLTNSGLEIEQTGPVTIMVRSLPAIIANVDIKLLLKDIYKAMQVIVQAEDDLKSRLLTLYAEHGSVNYPGDMDISRVSNELRQLSCLTLPFSEKDHLNIWRTLNIEEIQLLINGEPINK